MRRPPREKGNRKALARGGWSRGQDRGGSQARREEARSWPARLPFCAVSDGKDNGPRGSCVEGNQEKEEMRWSRRVSTWLLGF